MNVEVRYSTDLNLAKIVRAKRFHTSSFDISCSIFCGSLLNFHVSYESRLWPQASSLIDDRNIVQMPA